MLSFATGTSRVPLGGFVELQGVQGVQRFSIHKAYGEVDRLPQAHTCACFSPCLLTQSTDIVLSQASTRSTCRNTHRTRCFDSSCSWRFTRVEKGLGSPKGGIPSTTHRYTDSQSSHDAQRQHINVESNAFHVQFTHNSMVSDIQHPATRVSYAECLQVYIYLPSKCAFMIFRFSMILQWEVRCFTCL